MRRVWVAEVFRSLLVALFHKNSIECLWWNRRTAKVLRCRFFWGIATIGREEAVTIERREESKMSDLGITWRCWIVPVPSPGYLRGRGRQSGKEGAEDYSPWMCLQCKSLQEQRFCKHPSNCIHLSHQMFLLSVKRTNKQPMLLFLQIQLLFLLYRWMTGNSCLQPMYCCHGEWKDCV